MLDRVRLLLEMIRFSHTIFALPFAMLSAVLAWQGHSDHWIVDLIGILLCLVCARSAAMAFNRLADRHLDARNPRTSSRHLPAGKLSLTSVWAFTICTSLGFLASTSIFWFHGNPWPARLALPVLGFICAYSYTKRFTFLCHAWLGTSLLLAPLSAWIAIRGFESLGTPLVLGGAVLFWVTGFDILYACQDMEFDRAAKLASVPALLGVSASLKVALACHLGMLGFLLGLTWAAAPLLGGIYLAGVAVAAMLIAYEHWLVRPDDLSRVNQAFFQVNGVISVGLFLVVLLQLAVR